MGSSLRQWESDPLFSAAEIVQDSADRMESIFRLLLHEQGLIEGDQPDPKQLASIDYHKRDLATIVETTKWQLEDFEREVSTAVVADKSQLRDDVISRRKQFIEAIREQVTDVEKSLQVSSVGNSVKSSGWVNLNDQAKDNLALFLTGGVPIIPFHENDSEDSNMLRRFLDPTATSNFDNDVAENAEHKCRNIERSDLNEMVGADNSYETTKENGLRKMVSRSSARVGLEVSDSVHKTLCNGHIEDGSWDMEANEARPNNLLPDSILRGPNGRTNILNSLWMTSGDRLTKNYTKRIKDGEIYQQTSMCTDGSLIVQEPNTSMRLTTLCKWFQRMYIGILTKIVLLRSSISRYWSRYERPRSDF